jgi:flagellar hook-length control protein FliK
VLKPVTPETASLRTANASRVIDQITSKMTFRPGQNEIQIRLEPPSLGTVRMNVSTSGDSVRTVIVTENQAVKQVVENSLSQLRDSMNGQGLKVDSFTVLVGGNPHQAFQQGKPFENGFNFGSVPGQDNSQMSEAAGEPEPMNHARPGIPVGLYSISVFA